MAERLKEQILEKRKTVDIVCGPDAYKDLPRLLAITKAGQTAGRNRSLVVWVITLRKNEYMSYEMVLCSLVCQLAINS